MPQSIKHIFISAGEASGDLYAANLVKSVHAINPDIIFFGIGGDHMRAAGVEVIVDLTEISVVGVSEVLVHLQHIMAALKKVRYELHERNPGSVILIDCPGINLRIARTAKKLNQKVLYYISPQIWAWRPGRIKKIRKLVDKMLVIFPFEEEIYKNAKIPVTYVGHPLIDEVKTSTTKLDSKKYFKINTENKIIALMPGSRKSEIKNLLPIQIETAKQLSEKYKNITFILPIASSLTEKQIKPYLTDDLDIRIINDRKYDALSMCDEAIVTSGTATLELALLGIPMTIIYTVSFFTYWLGRLLINVQTIGLCNIVHGEKIIQEFIQKDATPTNIANEIEKIIDDKNYRHTMINNLHEIKSKLGTSGCSSKVAHAVLNVALT